MIDATATAATAPAIQIILEKSYGADVEGFYPMNQKLSVEILSLLNRGDLENIERKVTNVIWNNYAGENLAESVANEIVEAFNLV